jgi:cytochrome c biogenesis protein CcmG/thiol:disulfide interchange protein DsbE
MRRLLQLAASAVVLALLGLLVWDLTHNATSDVAQKVNAGKIVPAPRLVLPHLQGRGTFDLASYRGQVVVVNFWASWCLGCKDEARALAAAAKRWKPKGVVFVGVDAQDFSGAAKRFVARYDIPYKVIRDREGATLGHWGVTAFPETFFVDGSGRLVPPHIEGAASRAEIDEGIRRALAT